MPLTRKPLAQIPPSPADSGSILAALADGTDEERWSAARAMTDVPGGVKVIGHALAREANPRVREALLTSLARIGSSESVEILHNCLRSDSANVRTGALDALHAMKGHVKPHMARFLRDADSDVRLLACELARNLSDEEATRALCELLHDEKSPNVCAAAVEVLADVGKIEALSALAACAERFRGTEFLDFSIQLAVDRIRSQSCAK